jgi:periplasmic protein TonB
MDYRHKTVWVLALIAGLMAGPVLAQEGVKKVSRAEAMQAATSRVQPEYPPIARQLKVEGTVELEAVIGENGKVEKVNIVSGNAMLTRAGADALKQWKFTPFTEDGKPVKAQATFAFAFKL